MIAYRKVSDFKRGTLFQLLKDAYAYDGRYEEHFSLNWRECDDFFYDNIHIGDSCCIVTVLDDEAIGFVSWDPRNMPDYVEIGHNCVATKFKGMKYGKLQLEEALSRNRQNELKKIIVTTNQALVPAQRNYESVGFKLVEKRVNNSETSFSGDYIDYEYQL
ncbi:MULTISPECIES: N-acetyltransferase [unclassified Fusibacter]|uniref:GNAT family N-acetyltransferase n=1 Tax=unclassified Fusibacter TaxID=2624464 RepID=UPI001FA981BB|nr:MULTISPECIES: GNAT family N-acetyltransferase [unclassified Fusibacter]MCK8059007.1 GNAT family N-acetyltransferase [Fusibacter sp. A2]